MARLLVLWLLSERALTGYEIKRALTDRGMAFWFGLEEAAIYSALRTLTKHGYAVEAAREQQGRRPPRTRYRLTAAGRRHYEELLAQALATVRLPVSPVDVALAAAADLPPALAEEALHRREAAVARLTAELEEHRASAPAGSLADRIHAHLLAEAAWLAALDRDTLT